jgi:transcriptional regulator of nitric oxide reductase
MFLYPFKEVLMAEAANKDTGQSKPGKVKYRKAKASWNPAMQAIPVP